MTAQMSFAGRKATRQGSRLSVIHISHRPCSPPRVLSQASIFRNQLGRAEPRQTVLLAQQPTSRDHVKVRAFEKLNEQRHHPVLYHLLHNATSQSLPQMRKLARKKSDLTTKDKTATSPLHCVQTTRPGQNSTRFSYHESLYQFLLPSLAEVTLTVD